MYAKLMKIIQQWLKPQADLPSQAFHERNLRLIILLAVPALFIVVIASNIGQSNLQGWTTSSIWFGSILCVALVVAIAIQYRRIKLANRLIMLVCFTTLLDASAAYWSPGTVVLVVFYSFLFFWVLPKRHEVALAIALNWLVYLYIVINSSTDAPLVKQDLYSEKIPAFIGTVLSSVIFVIIGYYIRQDQRRRDAYLFQLRQQYTSVLSEFLTNISHDLKTPITSLRLRLYLMQKDDVANSAKHYQPLERSVDHLDNILNHVLAIVRLDGGVDFKPVETNINSIIINAIENHAKIIEDKQFKFAFRVEGGIFQLADPNFLQQAIDNILENALFNTPEKGEIIIHLHRSNTETFIDIQDNGAGISAKKLPNIFELFYRGDESRNTVSGKLGLGLPISERILKMHGGRIEVESEVGQGSKFRLVLPRIIANNE